IAAIKYQHEYEHGLHDPVTIEHSVNEMCQDDNSRIETKYSQNNQTLKMAAEQLFQNFVAIYLGEGHF
ncbi:hypothetical protein STEG23_010804, partial [Scotinomys teguina]